VSPPPTPAQPYPPAVDYNPTVKDVSDQVAAMSSTLNSIVVACDNNGKRINGLQVVVANTKEDVADLVREHGEGIDTRVRLIHNEIALLRATVTGDHAPRLTRIEESLVGRAKSLGAWVGNRAGIASLIVAGAIQLAALYKPSLVTPLQTVATAVKALAEQVEPPAPPEAKP
jgi:hypothetical protein